LWVRTLWDLLATALAERIKHALVISTLVGSSSTLSQWSGLAAAAGGILLIAPGFSPGSTKLGYTARSTPSAASRKARNGPWAL
jgi:hypothetical protein